ncbi:MAG: hypothetical protein NW217_16565 [Hyphomicrobiaceae bacterium]|nr:hypothetical protein [Hyphomicrobiaceae bacterium]
MAKAPEKSAKTQRQRFIEAARAAGADGDEESFEQQLRAVAGANSSKGAKKPTARKPRQKGEK